LWPTKWSLAIGPLVTALTPLTGSMEISVYEVLV